MAANFVINLDSRKYKDGTQPVVLECYDCRKGKTTHRRRIICRVKPEQFDPEARRVINHPNQSLLNMLISKIYHEAEARKCQLELENKPVTIDGILGLQEPSHHNKTLFLAYGKLYVERSFKDDHVHTADKYSSHLTKLSQYLGKYANGSQKDIPMDEVTGEWILQWASWLRNHGTKSSITMHRRMGFISTLFTDARRKGLITANPMASLRFKESKVRKNKLNLEQLGMLEKAKLPPSFQDMLINARNTFMLQFFAHGTRISDALSWKKENIVRRPDGVYLLYSSRKTDTPMTIRLNSHAVALVDHYLATVPGPFLLPWLSDYREKPNLSSQYNTRRMLRQISSKTSMINESLKTIERTLGLGIRLTTHVARHTFAHLADRAIGDPRAVSAALGHTNFSTTEVYLADLNADQINDVLKKLWKKGKWL